MRHAMHWWMARIIDRLRMGSELIDLIPQINTQHGWVGETFVKQLFQAF